MTTLADIVDANDGVLSFREAIIAANANTDLDTIKFDPALFVGAPGKISGNYSIEHDVVIDGPGAKLLTIRGTAGAVFVVQSGVNTTLRGLTIHGGTAFESNAGGIESYASSLTVEQCLISANFSALAGGVYQSGGNLTIRDSTIAGNAGRDGAGGVLVTNGNATILNSTVSNNVSISHTGAALGGITFVKSDGAITNSTVSGNYGYLGRGILLQDHSDVDVQNSILSGNSYYQIETDRSSSYSALNCLIGNASKLGVLTDNGGCVPTQALLPGSNAIDAGDPNAVAGANGIPIYDARGAGYARVLDADGVGGERIDIGAFEFASEFTPKPKNWFDFNVQDAALRSLGSSLYADSVVNRDDMMALFESADDGGVVDATELADLRAIVANTTLFGSATDVQALAGYVVNDNVANAKFQGSTLGNLAAGSSSTQLDTLVDKWFRGLDHPASNGVYRSIAGQLFVNGATYNDIKQGSVGDCYLTSTLAEVAYRSPEIIADMFIANGDGTYTVRFFNQSDPYFVTVDSYLPTNNNGSLIYAGTGAAYNNSSNELWVPLAEKAYVQLNEFGFVRPGLQGSGQNVYSAIDGGYIYAAMNHVTGQSTTGFVMTNGGSSFDSFVNAFNSGKMIAFASYASPPAESGVVGSHAYAVVGYDAAAQTVTLFNPWGSQYGLLTLTWSQIQAGFQYFDRTV